MKYVASGLLIILAVVILWAWPVQLLWNWLMTDLFSLPRITFWQAVGLNFLSSALFKSNINTNSK